MKKTIIVNCAVFKDKIVINRLGRVKYELPMINSWVIEVSDNNLMKLDKIQGVEEDTMIIAQMNSARSIVNSNYALSLGITGAGIGIAVLDTGVYPHRDFISKANRIVAFKDFVNKREKPYDDNGHGTHVIGVLGGDGTASGKKYAGIAPKCNIVAVKVLDRSGNGNISDLLAGLQWVIDNRIKYNIRVVNISVGREDDGAEGEKSSLVKGVDYTWNAGMAVVVAAGNNGPASMSITTPGISRRVITVGASDDERQVNIFGNKKVNYSGRGPTKYNVLKPDLVAPGSHIVACQSDTRYNGLGKKLRNDGYTVKSGTSMSTPIVSGAIALLLEKVPELTNIQIKEALVNSATDMGFDSQKQGAGLLNIKKMLENT